jgi:hypothetical protein
MVAFGEVKSNWRACGASQGVNVLFICKIKILKNMVATWIGGFRSAV